MELGSRLPFRNLADATSNFCNWKLGRPSPTETTRHQGLEFGLRFCSDLAKGRPIALQRELWAWLWLLCRQLAALTCGIHKGLGLAEGFRLRVAEEPNGHVESVF